MIHNIGRCPLSAYEVSRMLQTRIRTFEEHGMTILQTHESIPLYTNMIRGLTNRFLHWNPRINPCNIQPHIQTPSRDPYLLPHLCINEPDFDSSSDEFYDASPYSANNIWAATINITRMITLKITQTLHLFFWIKPWAIIHLQSYELELIFHLLQAWDLGIS